jgi:hypothetical protein
MEEVDLPPRLPGGGGMMLKVLESVMPRITRSARNCPTVRSVRPSLLDLRFTGDPCVVDQQDGTATVRLDNYRLARIRTSPFDVPTLNNLFLQLRHWQIRRRMYRQLRARARQPV